MDIGDIEYTRLVPHTQITGGEHEIEDVAFALGIRIRPLLTRVHATLTTVLAITGSSFIGLENGQAVPAGQAGIGTLQADGRVFTLNAHRRTLVTSGFPSQWGPLETTWWKILLPDVRLHFDQPTTGTVSQVTLHYRFATLTPDEIIEIAGQRAQA